YDARGQAVRSTRYDAVYSGQDFTLSALESFASAQAAPVEGHKIYDARGQLAYEVDPEGYVTGYSYNAAGQVIETRQYSGALPESGITYSVAGIEAWLPKQVTWGYQSSGTSAYQGDALRISSGNATWDESVRSADRLRGDGYLEFTLPGDGQRIMAGLNKTNDSDDYSDIDFAVYRNWENHLKIFEEGAEIANLGKYDPQTRVRIVAEGNQVKYYLKSPTDSAFVLRYTSANAYDGTADYFVDSSILDQGAKIEGAVLGQHLAMGESFLQISRIVYDDRGQARFSINALGQVTENRYDHAGRATETLRYAGTYTGTEMTESALAAFAATQTEGTQSTHKIYDDRGQVRYAVDAGGYVTAYTYNAQG
ncbi:RHS repeat domain-containing protein, partial [Hahella ganghwensis]|uniref:RHS repeat domain-containing protein n=1 Tax=Hahella ganghwensis TaxID=286420 RepID=UPI00052412CB